MPEEKTVSQEVEEALTRQLGTFLTATLDPELMQKFAKSVAVEAVSDLLNNWSTIDMIRAPIQAKIEENIKDLFESDEIKAKVKNMLTSAIDRAIISFASDLEENVKSVLKNDHKRY